MNSIQTSTTSLPAGHYAQAIGYRVEIEAIARYLA